MSDNETSAPEVNASDAAYPSRRALRASGAFDAPAISTATSTPADPERFSPRRAARAAHATAAPAVPAVPLAPADVPTVAMPAVTTAPSVAAPFGLFEPSPSLAGEHDRATRITADGAASETRRGFTTPTPNPRPLRKRLTGAGAMVLASGLFMSLNLPAFASNDYAGVLDTAPDVAAQTLSLDTADIEATAVSGEARDGYDATSASDLRRLHRDALRQQNLAAYLASGAKEMGDDYPWAAELTRGQGGGLSPLNYFYRECVDFVAWRLNRDAGSTKAPFVYNWSTLTPGSGSAYAWKRQWERHGWPVSTTPQPGWVAWFPGGNHVAYVSGILDDGSVAIEEYNWGPHIYNQRVIAPGDAIYLSPPPR